MTYIGRVEGEYFLYRSINYNHVGQQPVMEIILLFMWLLIAAGCAILESALIYFLQGGRPVSSYTSICYMATLNNW